MTAPDGALPIVAGAGDEVWLGIEDQQPIPVRRRPQTLFSLAGCLALVVAALFIAAPHASAQGLAATARSVHGRVLSPSGALQANAVVYLENQKNQTVKSYITGEDGAYRFVQLNPNVDYQVWAKYKELKSKSHTISSFESRQSFQFDLKLEPQK